MRICKPNEAGLIFGLGNPTWGGFNMAFLPPQPLESLQSASTNPTPTISTPNVGSVSPISPGVPDMPTVNAPSLIGGGLISPGSVTPAPDPQFGEGLNMCPNLGPGPAGPTSEAPSDADNEGGISAGDGLGDSDGVA